MIFQFYKNDTKFTIRFLYVRFCVKMLKVNLTKTSLYAIKSGEAKHVRRFCIYGIFSLCNQSDRSNSGIL